jgi:hypothetical protein
MQADHGQTVTLTGSATHGVGPAAQGMAEFPVQVRLGRIRPAALPAVPRFRAFFDRQMMAAAPPAATDRRKTAAQSLARMYMNDRLGCCVISGKAHALGLWSGADANPSGVVLATDREVQDQYVRVCGPGDRGCQITSVLDYCRTQGFLAGGVRYRIDGYVAIDHADELEVQVSSYLFGALTIGINLPQAWTQNSVWDVTNSQIVGGHDVTIIDYDEKGAYVSSWGRVYLLTWAALKNRQWVEECYALLAPLWYGADNLAPSGVDVSGLKAALDSLAHGVLPPLPDPHPTPTPIPPPTPAGTHNYTLAIDAATGKPSITQVN